MAITSFAAYQAAKKQKIFVQRNSLTSVAGGFFSVFGNGNIPAAGTLAGVNTANGVVPTDATAGYPLIVPFDAGTLGYLTKVECNISNATRFFLYDRLFVAGAYAFNANTTLTAQPSFSGRLPNTDYTGVELWVETVTAFTGNLSIAVTYTNQDGTTGRTTGTVATGVAPTVGRCIQLPLQAGDTGVQKIESVVATVATAGTFNLMLLRPLWAWRTTRANEKVIDNYVRTGIPQIYDTSALYCLCATDSTATGTVNYILEIANA